MLRALSLLGLLMALWPPPSAAQTQCGDRAVMVEQLKRIYGESRHGAGLSGGGAFFEIWANCSTGTWTILKTYPRGRACVMASGANWRGAGCKARQPV